MPSVGRTHCMFLTVIADDSASCPWNICYVLRGDSLSCWGHQLFRAKTSSVYSDVSSSLLKKIGPNTKLVLRVSRYHRVLRSWGGPLLLIGVLSLHLWNTSHNMGPIETPIVLHSRSWDRLLAASIPKFLHLHLENFQYFVNLFLLWVCFIFHHKHRYFPPNLKSNCTLAA